MANSFSLATQGSVKKINNSQSGIIGGITKAATGLYNGVKGLAQKNVTPNTENNVTSVTGQAPLYSKPAAPTVTPGLIPAPSTPVKSVTHNGVDGSSTTTAFHAPASPTNNTDTKKPNPNGLTDSQVQQGYSTVPGQYSPLTGLRNDTNSSTGISQNGFIPQQNIQKQEIPTQTLNQSTVTALANKGIQTGPEYTKAQSNYENDKQALADFQQQAADQRKAINEVPGILTQTMGQQANLAQTVASKEAALQGAINADSNVLNAANSQQGLQQSALSESAGFTQPQSQFGLLTDPQTGQPLNPGLANNMVQQAAQLVQNGSSLEDAISQSGLDQLGGYGKNALTQQLSQRGNYNPTALNAAANANAQNIGTTGTIDINTAASGYGPTIQQYQGAGAAFDTAYQQANNLVDTMNKLGINSSNSQDWNTALNAAGSKLGSSKLSAFTATLAEAQQAYTNLLSSVGAATPTVNGEQATAIFNPSSTPEQIAQGVDALNQAAYAKLAPQYQQALTYYNQLHQTNATSIPGYPVPKLPASIAKTPAKGADLSAENLAKGGSVFVGNKLLDKAGDILNHITTVVGKI